MDSYHRVLRHQIDAHGGTVEKFAGDAVMAVFGAPVAHEDDAERAVRAGQGIVRALADRRLAIDVRVGVNTGECLVDLQARPQAGEAYATGDVVNTAARIQTAAPVNAVLVGESTYLATRRIFDFSSESAVTAKGKSQPLPVWRAGAPKARLGSDVIRNLTTPMIGRDIDLAVLRATYDKCARDSTIHLVTVVGEPGVGKSRLVAELARQLNSPSDVIWRQGRCLPYGDGVTFWALAELIKAHAGIFDTDETARARAKLVEVLPETVDPGPTLDRLLPLLGIETKSVASQEQSFGVWRSFITSLARGGPAVVVFEDLHWADPQLLDFVETLADSTAEVPLLVVCTARPELFETRADWGTARLNGTTIRLARLSDSETADLISARLDRAVLPVTTQREILDRVGGNPLYAEEFAAMLRDRDLLTPTGELRPDVEVPLPDGMHSLIASRLDSLSRQQHSLVQDAAVIGVVFWSGALAAVSACDLPTVEAELHQLIRRELLRPMPNSSMQGELEYTFRHVLTRDVAYQQLPRLPRARLHLAALAWIAQRSADRVADAAEVLAYHATEALTLARAADGHELVTEATEQARRYSLLAARRAIGTDTPAAVKLLTTAAELASPGTLEYSRTMAKLGRALFDAGRFREAREALEIALPTLRASDHPDRVNAAVLLFNVYFAVGEPTAPIVSVLEEAVESLPPGALSIRAQEWIALAEVATQTTDSQRRAVERSTQALETAAILGLPIPLVAAASRGRARAALGDPGGLEELESAVQSLADAGRTSISVGLMQWLAGARHHWRGSLAELVVRDELDEIARTRGMRYLIAFGVAERVRVLLEMGRLRDAISAAADAGGAAEGRARFAIIARAIALLELGELDDEELQRVAGTEPIDEEDLRHELGRALVIAGAALARGDVALARTAVTCLPPARKLAAREGAMEQLPRLVRSALAAGCPETVDELRYVDREPATPLRRCVFHHVDGLLAAHASEYERALHLLGAAADGWARLDQRLEQAYALLSIGATMREAGHDCSLPIRQARAHFAVMEALPRIKECDAFRGRT
jgi:tetratricopeptide (TPR) repeat protein